MILVFHLQHSNDTFQRYKGCGVDKPCLDLIFAYLPMSLRVPRILNLPSSIPTWNIESKVWLETVFDFAEYHLQDDGAIILFHPFWATTK